MACITWLIGVILAATLMGGGQAQPTYPLKPVMMTEAVPHIAAVWDRQWIEAARQQFARRQAPRGDNHLAGLLLLSLIFIIWAQGRLELRRNRRARPSDSCTGSSTNLCHTLAPRWGLR